METRTLEQSDELLSLHGWSDLDTNGVSYTTEIFNMSSSELSRTVANPQEVSRGVIKRIGFGVFGP